MNLSTFLQTQNPIIVDGGMGTQLALRGLPMGGQNNLNNPDAVLSVHRAYIEAGSDILITNTLTMNRIYAESHKVDIDLRAVNHAGARLAKTACGEGKYAVGDIGSTGQMLEPYGDRTEEEFVATFKEQAEYLAEGGVDGFVVETMMDLREALCALRGCKAAAPDLPVIVTMCFNTVENGGCTIMGNSAMEIAKTLTEAGAAVVGTNCGDLDPLQIATIVATMKQNTTLPILVEPNAGKPRLVGTETVFDMEPERFADGIEACIRAGARMAGGCCGTGPDHIRAVAERIKG
jgi:5-methyltetrahydrofolate--homocysteine methyltransferase